MSKRPRDEGSISSIKAILGDIPNETIERLLHRSNNNVEAAINLYFTDPPPPQPTPMKLETNLNQGSSFSSSNHRSRPKSLKYYIGDIVVEGYSLVKGVGIINDGDPVAIVRDKTSGNSHNIVRFSLKGREVGRMSSDVSNYMSTLIDQQLCLFEGIIVSAPRIISITDNVLLSIKCYLLPAALQTSTFDAPLAKRRTAGRKAPQYDMPVLKKLALLQIFKRLGLTPSRSAMQTMNDSDSSLDMVIQSITKEDGEPIKEEVPVAEDMDDEDEDKKEVTDDQLNTIYEKAQIFDSQIKPMEPPSTLTLELKEYQKRALAWMTAKEANYYDDGDVDMRVMHPLWEEYTFPGEFADEHRFFYFNPYSGELSLEFPEANKQETGGILADEMGLGKTIEILSLIHTNRYKPNSSTPPPFKEHKSPTTLIVCPMSLLAQWRDEIIRASEPGCITVELFYGDDRSKTSIKHLCKWDGTAPDVLITTYGVAMTDWSNIQDFSVDRERSPLFETEFWRVVLDEAHQIKNRNSKTSLACKDIKAKRRWAVTGTPIQNKLDDLYSLVRFLHHEPWANHTFWKTFITIPFEKKDKRAIAAVQNVLEPIVLRRTKAMRDNNGDLMVPLPPKTINIEYLEFSREEQDIYDAIYNDSQIKFSYYRAAGKIGKNYASIFQLLTRLRQICCHPHLALQGKDAQKQEIDSGSGRVMSLEDLIAKSQSSSAEGGSSYELSVLQNMLAQQEGSSFSLTSSPTPNTSDIPPIIDECPICFETVDTVICTPCMHMACRPCVMDYFQKKEDEGEPGECPTCRRSPIDQSELLEFARHNTTKDSKVRFEIQKAIGGFKRSTKMQALTRHLRQYADEGLKTVVFSQFTSFLDLIEEGLRLESIEFTRLDGTQSQPQREKVLSSFTSSDGPGVLLISLRAGGIGLNLTCASRIIMMDPWWNFAIEAQAIDRVHRLGQLNDVVVTRFIMRDSIEEKILAIQNRKHVLVNELYMSNNADSKTRRLEELQILFGTS